MLIPLPFYCGPKFRHRCRIKISTWQSSSSPCALSHLPLWGKKRGEGWKSKGISARSSEPLGQLGK